MSQDTLSLYPVQVTNLSHKPVGIIILVGFKGYRELVAHLSPAQEKLVFRIHSCQMFVYDETVRLDASQEVPQEFLKETATAAVVLVIVVEKVGDVFPPVDNSPYIFLVIFHGLSPRSSFEVIDDRTLFLYQYITFPGIAVGHLQLGFKGLNRCLQRLVQKIGIADAVLQIIDCFYKSLAFHIRQGFPTTGFNI